MLFRYRPATQRFAGTAPAGYGARGMPTDNTPDVVTGIALDEEAVRTTVKRLAREVVQHYRVGSRILAVVILEGARRFADDLLCSMLGYTSARFELVRLKAESYHGGTESSGEVKLTDTGKVHAGDRDVLLIDDIYDTGRTLTAVRAYLEEQGARSIKTCVLLEKRRKHEVPAQVDFIGTLVDDRFLIGYGLDLDGEYRDLPYVAFADEASE